MRSAVLLALCVALAGCFGTRPPAALRTAGLTETLTHDADPQITLHLGPHVLQVALPLLLARHAPHAPLYLRHVDRLYLSVYTIEDASSDPLATLPPSTSWKPVLCLRDEDSTMWVLHPPNPATLDRFALLIDDGDERIVAYAEGRLLPLLRFALRANT